MTTQFIALPSRQDDIDFIVNAIKSRVPSWTGRNSDPLYYAIESLVDQEHGLISNVNTKEAASNFYNVFETPFPRLPNETDSAYTERVRNTLQLTSGETNERLVAALKSGVPTVSDASFERDTTRDYKAKLYVQGFDTAGVGHAPSTPQLRTDAENWMNDKPNTSWQTEYEATTETRTPYTVSGTVIYKDGVGVDEPLLRTEIRDALNLSMYNNRRFGQGIYDSDVEKDIINYINNSTNINLHDVILDINLVISGGDKTGLSSTVFVGSIASTGWIVQFEGQSNPPSGALVS